MITINTLTRIIIIYNVWYNIYSFSFESLIYAFELGRQKPFLFFFLPKKVRERPWTSTLSTELQRTLHRRFIQKRKSFEEEEEGDTVPHWNDLQVAFCSQSTWTHWERTFSPQLTYISSIWWPVVDTKHKWWFFKIPHCFIGLWSSCREKRCCRTLNVLYSQAIKRTYQEWIFSEFNSDYWFIYYLKKEICFI